MWRVGLHDLLHRKRRFVIAVLATAIAFGLALLLAGTMEHLQRENERSSDLSQPTRSSSRRADGSVQHDRLIAGRTADELPGRPGGTSRPRPFTQVRECSTIKRRQRARSRRRRSGWPTTATVACRAPGEVLVDDVARLRRWRHDPLGGRPATVVGTHRHRLLLWAADGVLPLATCRVFPGRRPSSPRSRRRRARLATAGTVVFSTRRAAGRSGPAEEAGTRPSQIISMLLWIMAAGVVASMLYLSVTERTTDLATMQGHGSRPASRCSPAGTAGLRPRPRGLRGRGLCRAALAPVFPFPVEIPTAPTCRGSSPL